MQSWIHNYVFPDQHPNTKYVTASTRLTNKVAYLEKETS